MNVSNVIQNLHSKWNASPLRLKWVEGDFYEKRGQSLMSFDAYQFMVDYGIDFVPGPAEDTGKNWYGVQCPLCDDSKKHGGFHKVGGGYYCHRCENKDLVEVVTALAGTKRNDAFGILKQYGVQFSKHIATEKKIYRRRNIDIKFPYGTRELRKPHQDYLRNRNFDPFKIEKEWNLLGTAKFAGSWSHRIIIPVYDSNNTLLSYQGRDITGRSSIRYKALENEKSILDLKYCLYGVRETTGKRVLVCEGPIDVWRLGYGSVAFFGTSHTLAQLIELSRFDTVFIFFDQDEPESIVKAEMLTFDLSMIGVDAYAVNADIDCDPGDLDDEDAEYLMRELRIR